MKKAICHLPLATRKKENPFFSIIIPVYNVAPYLRECLDSVLAQTFADWEGLCVDDGSTDESGAILDEYAKKDHRFRVFHKPNGGVSSVRNLALDNAKGEWILFLDSDDCLFFDACEVLLDISKRENVDFIKFNHTMSQGERAYTEKKCQIFDCTTQKGLQEGFRLGFTPFVCGGAIKRTIVDGIRFEKYTHCEDTLFMVMCFFNLSCFAIINDVLYFYRRREDSAVRQHTLEHLRSSLAVVEHLFAWACKQPKFSILHRQIYKRIKGELAGHCYSLMRLIEVKDRKSAKKFLKATVAKLFNSPGFHWFLFRGMCYRVLGFFSWSLVVVLLRLDNILKAKLVTMIKSF